MKKAELLAGKTHVKKLPKDITLQEVLDAYIEKSKKTRSPASVRSNISYSKNRFPDYRDKNSARSNGRK